MTDRELLELAAKATGYDTSHRWNADRAAMNPPVLDICIPGVSTGWNPLDNDGDALRLAVKLRLLIQPDEYETIVIPHCEDVTSGWFITEEAAEDKYSATRRAIVRAAAEIGKAMQ